MTKQEIKDSPAMNEIISFRVPVHVHIRVKVIAGEKQQTISSFMRNVLRGSIAEKPEDK